MTVCGSKKRYHWSKTCIICFSHHIPRLSADTCHHPFPCWHMTLAQTPPPGISWYMDDPLSYILYTKLPLLKLFSNCCLLCFLLLSQLVVNEISVYRVKGEWFSSTFVFVSILLCHRQGLEGCSIKISLNISACSLHYWCQFQYNLLFHMHICVSYLEFVNLGVGYTLRLIKSKLSMILQDLVFHTKLK